MGLVGVLPFLALNFMFYKRLISGFQKIKSLDEKWMVWCIGCGVFGWNIAMMTVGALDQLQNLIFIMAAICGNIPIIVANARNEASQPLQSPVANAQPRNPHSVRAKKLERKEKLNHGTRGRRRAHGT